MSIFVILIKGFRISLIPTWRAALSWFLAHVQREQLE